MSPWQKTIVPWIWQSTNCLVWSNVCDNVVFMYEYCGDLLLRTPPLEHYKHYPVLAPPSGAWFSAVNTWMLNTVYMCMLPMFTLSKKGRKTGPTLGCVMTNDAFFFIRELSIYTYALNPNIFKSKWFYKHYCEKL